VRPAYSQLPSERRIIKRMEKLRDASLDRLRGLAIFLMIIDHILVVYLFCWSWDSWAEWVRRTLTRFAMPLFMLVSGLLIARKGRPSLRRIPQVAFAALVLNQIFWNLPELGFGAPEILATWLICLALYPLWVRFPIEMAVLGILQFVNWPITASWWLGYQPGEVLAFLALGALLARREDSAVLRAGHHLPRWLEPMGRWPLTWYTVHLLVLAVAGVLLLEY
jgi:uncharacterized membrane protein